MRIIVDFLFNICINGLKIWEISDVTISDVVRALAVDDYILLNDIIVVPNVFKLVMAILFVSCFLWSLMANLRTLMTILIQK